MPLDPSNVQILASLAAGGMKPLTELTPDDVRAAGKSWRGDLYGHGPEVQRSYLDELAVGGGDTIPVRVVVPHGPVAAVMAFLHGGGWVAGGIHESEPLARSLAARTGSVVVMIGYRKAPEHPFPTPVEDAEAGVAWCAEHIEQLAGAPVPLLVAGDSSGGNLAAVVARRARDAGGPAIAAQVLLYPITDSDLDRPSYTDPDNQLFLSRDAMAWSWDHYISEPARRVHPDASPLRAETLAGLPPTVIVTAELDPARDEGEHYAQRLADAGVTVMVRRFDGQMHAFAQFVDAVPASDGAVAFAAECLRAVLADVGAPVAFG